MRRHLLAGALLATLVTAPAVAQPPLAAAWAGLGYEICPLAEGFPCSYHGESLTCTAYTHLEGRPRPYTMPCHTSLVGAVHPDRTTSGQFRYVDEFLTEYLITVAIDDGVYQGSITAEDGTFSVSGTLHPFVGVLRME